MVNMKTTIEIPDPLYRQVKIRAVEQGTTVKDIMIRGLRREIEGERSPVRTPSMAREEKAVYNVNDLGFVVLKREGVKTVVTDAMINKLREKEGV